MVKEGDGAFLPFIPVNHVILDILHLELRICPAIWRLTVSNHVDKDRLHSICQWIADEHKIIISKGTAVQSSTGKKGKIGSDCWPGKICSKVLQIFPAVMDRVHTNEVNKASALLCWELFAILMHKLKIGCDDDDQDSVNAHADEIQLISEKFMKACIGAGLGMNRTTVYMHAAMAHLPDQIRAIGSMSKGSSQGAERMHQDSQKLTKHHSNKKKETVCRTTLTKLLSRGAALSDENFKTRRGRGEILLQPGGHLSIADRQARDVTMKQSFQKHEADLYKPLSSSENESSDSDDEASDIDDDASSNEDESSEDDA